MSIGRQQAPMLQIVSYVNPEPFTNSNTFASVNNHSFARGGKDLQLLQNKPTWRCELEGTSTQVNNMVHFWISRKHSRYVLQVWECHKPRAYPCERTPVGLAVCTNAYGLRLVPPLPLASS